MPMRSAHPTDDALALYAAGELDELATRGVEVHVRACAGCADRLAQAATAELALLAIAEQPVAAAAAEAPTPNPTGHPIPNPTRTGNPARRRRRTAIVAAGAALAAAAALLLAVRDRGDRPPAPSPDTAAQEVAELADDELFVPEADDDDLDLPSGAELVVFIPEAAP